MIELLKNFRRFPRDNCIGRGDEGPGDFDSAILVARSGVMCEMITAFSFISGQGAGKTGDQHSFRRSRSTKDRTAELCAIVSQWPVSF
jgi:hypothetical protein